MKVRIKLGYAVVDAQTGQAITSKVGGKKQRYGLLYPTKRGARAALGQMARHLGKEHNELATVEVTFSPDTAEYHEPSKRMPSLYVLSRLEEIRRGQCSRSPA